MKVFSKKKFIETMGETLYQDEYYKSWVDDFDGLTVEEIKKRYYRLYGS